MDDNFGLDEDLQISHLKPSKLIKLDHEETWTLQTTHDPPFSCTIFQSTLDNLQLDLITKSQNFAESKQRLFIMDKSVCLVDSVWKTLFQTLQSFSFGMEKIDYDKNHLLETYQLYDYICVENDNPLFHKFITKLKKDWETFTVSDFTFEGLTSLFHLCAQQPHQFSSDSIICCTNQIHCDFIKNQIIQPFDDTDCSDLEKWKIVADSCDRLFWYEYPTHIHEAMMKRTITKSMHTFMRRRLVAWDFIYGQLGRSCIWAGGSLVGALINNTIEEKEKENLEGSSFLLEDSDVDIWIFSRDLLKLILEVLQHKYKNLVYFVQRGSVITVLFDKTLQSLPLQLIYMGPRDEEEQFRFFRQFDMDYTRCFCTGTTIYMMPECVLSHQTKKVYKTRSLIKESRHKKTLKKGFTFEGKFSIIPSKTAPQESFYPDSRIFSLPYNLVILKKFHPFCTVTTDIQDLTIEEIKDFGKNYSSHSIPIENVESLIDQLDILNIRPVHRDMQAIKFAQLNNEILIRLNNTSILTCGTFQPRNLKIQFKNIKESIVDCIKRIETKFGIRDLNSVIYQKLPYSPIIKARLPKGDTLKIMDIDDKPISFLQFLEMDLKNRRFNVSIKIKHMIKYNQTSALFPVVTEIQLLPLHCQIENKQWFGIVV
jgi:hypothetical protein